LARVILFGQAPLIAAEMRRWKNGDRSPTTATTSKQPPNTRRKSSTSSFTLRKSKSRTPIASTTDTDEPEEVEDPYYGGADGFEVAYQQAVRFSKALVEIVEMEAEGVPVPVIQGPPGKGRRVR